MAVIKITIEDIEGDKVKWSSSPTFEQMIKRHAAKKGLTAAHGYALCAINAILKSSQIGSPFQAIVDQYNKEKKNDRTK